MGRLDVWVGDSASWKTADHPSAGMMCSMDRFGSFTWGIGNSFSCAYPIIHPLPFAGFSQPSHPSAKPSPPPYSQRAAILILEINWYRAVVGFQAPGS